MLTSIRGTLLASVFMLLSAASLLGQSILVQQNQLVFTAQPGTISSVVNFPIQTTGGQLPYTLSFTPIAGGNWLTTSQASGNLPASVSLSANASGLSIGAYTGTLTISAPGASNSPLRIPVTFNVGINASNTISASVSSLSFSTQTAGLDPAPQAVSLFSFIGTSSFLATPFTSDGGGWLKVTPFSGALPSNITVSVQTAGLPAGNYTGSITVSPASGASLVIPVALAVSSGGVLNVSTNSLQLFYQTGNGFSPNQNLNFTSGGSMPVSFTLTPTTTSGGPWLILTQTTGITPQTVTVGAAIGGLAPGTYMGNIAVASTTAPNIVQNIAVTLTVSDKPLLTIGASPMPFNAVTGTPVASQTIPLGSTSIPLNFTVRTSTVTAVNWLSATPGGGTTPQNLTLAVNPSNLAPGTYNGTVTVTSPDAFNSPLSFNVTMNVSSNVTLAALPNSVNFVYQPSGNNLVTSQSLAVSSGGLATPVNITASTSTCGNWLQVYPAAATTPANIAVSMNTFVLPTTPQICSGLIQIAAPGIASAIQIPVSVAISTNPLLNVSPGALNYSATYQGNVTDPQAITLSPTTTGSILNYSLLVSTDNGGSWLRATPQGGLAPATINVTADPGSLNPGTYTGSVTVVSAALPSPRVIPVTFTVTAVTTAVATPSALAFTQNIGGNTPLPMPLLLSAPNGNFPFTITTSTLSGFNWLSVTPAGGTTPANLSVAVGGNGLTAGTYTGTIAIGVAGATNNPLLVPVTMTVVQSQGISGTPASLSFTYQNGGAVPAGQPINIVTTAGVTPFTASATTSNNSGNWLTVTPAAGTAPARLTVNVNPAGLATGTYTGQIAVAAPGVLGSPILVPVTLVIQSMPTPVITSVANAASGAQQSLAPGEIITIKGSNLGPATAAVFTPNAAGAVDTSLGGVRVLIGLTPAPILYASATQINAIVPYEAGQLQRAGLQVENQGITSATLTLAVAATAPGIFTADASGSGQAAILNQDFSVNSAANPAAHNSVVQVFATGEGQTNPPGVTGSITGAILRRPVGTVSATVGGLPAEVTYAGAAPQSVAGLFQVNVKIPDGAPSRPDVRIVITVGEVKTQAEATVAIQ